MSLLKSLLWITTLVYFTTSTTINAAHFEIRNNCPYTVWAAAVPGGGRQLNNNQIWSLNVPAGTKGARIWGRTGCTFNGAGRGHCNTGDCGGLLACQGYGQAPNTLAEFALNQGNLDYYDISLVDGFNVPMEFSPTDNGCTRGIKCRADLVPGCPSQLRATGGCNNPCTVFKTNEFCCTNGPGSCRPTNFSRYFKNGCPDAYSFPQDDRFTTVVFTCRSGTNYRVVFCP